MTLHPRRLELERLATGEASESRSHVDGCDACRATVDQLRLETRAFVQRQPLAAHDPQPWWRRWWPVGVLVPVAAAVTLFWSTPGDPDVRWKGSGLSMLRTRDGGTEPWLSGSPVSAGDRLSFVFEAEAPGHLLLLDVEQGKPAPQVLFPWGRQTSGALDAGVHALEVGFELDDTRADEWVVAVWRPTAVTLDEVSVRPALDGGLEVSCKDCRSWVRSITRERR